MSRVLALAALGVAAVSLVPVTSASACDPQGIPGCQPTACERAHTAYNTVHNAAGRGPTWYNLDLGVCGT